MGTNPAPMPWILCGPGLSSSDSRACVRTGLWTGSRAIIVTEALRCLSSSPIPVTVPPVPTPAMTMSTWPSVSSQISSAVVRRWTSGLAGLLNCWGMKALGVSATSFSADLIAPVMPSAAGVSTSSAPSALSTLRRSMLIESGMVRMQR